MYADRVDYPDDDDILICPVEWMPSIYNTAANALAGNPLSMDAPDDHHKLIQRELWAKWRASPPAQLREQVMNLDEALVVYLYLKNKNIPEMAAWERKAMEDAWTVICAQAKAVLDRRLKEIAESTRLSVNPS